MMRMLFINTFVSRLRRAHNTTFHTPMKYNLKDAMLLRSEAQDFSPAGYRIHEGKKL